MEVSNLPPKYSPGPPLSLKLYCYKFWGMRSGNSWGFPSSQIWTFKLMTEFWSNLTMALTRSFSLQSKLHDWKLVIYIFVNENRKIFVCRISAWFSYKRHDLTDVGSLKILMGNTQVMPAISIFPLLTSLKLIIFNWFNIWKFCFIMASDLTSEWGWV